MQFKAYKDLEIKGVSLHFGRSGAGHVEDAIRTAAAKAGAKVLVIVSSSLGHLDKSWGAFDVVDGVANRKDVADVAALMQKSKYTAAVWVGFDAYKSSIVMAYGEGMTQAQWGSAWKNLMTDITLLRDCGDLYLTADVVDVEREEISPEGKKTTKNEPTINLNGGLMNTITPLITDWVFVSVSPTGQRKYQRDAVLAVNFIAGASAQAIAAAAPVK